MSSNLSLPNQLMAVNTAKTVGSAIQYAVNLQNISLSEIDVQQVASGAFQLLSAYKPWGFALQETFEIIQSLPLNILRATVIKAGVETSTYNNDEVSQDLQDKSITLGKGSLLHKLLYLPTKSLFKAICYEGKPLTTASLYMLFFKRNVDAISINLEAATLEDLEKDYKSHFKIGSLFDLAKTTQNVHKFANQWKSNAGVGSSQNSSESFPLGSEKKTSEQQLDFQTQLRGELELLVLTIKNSFRQDPKGFITQSIANLPREAYWNFIRSSIKMGLFAASYFSDTVSRYGMTAILVLDALPSRVVTNAEEELSDIFSSQLETLRSAGKTEEKREVIKTIGHCVLPMINLSNRVTHTAWENLAPFARLVPGHEKWRGHAWYDLLIAEPDLSSDKNKEV